MTYEYIENFKRLGFGMMGKVSKEVIAQMPKCN